MNICFHAPFKPLGHPDPSGDQAIGRGLYRFFKSRGHRLWTPGPLRTRWIYWKPWHWPLWLSERRRTLRRLSRSPADLWFTYHSYYKAPDLLGPVLSRRLKIPYVLFQGIYATKRRRDIRTLPGFFLNRRALGTARHVFTNKRVDFVNLRRILPEQRLTYIAPGISTDDFRFDVRAGAALRRTWGVGNTPVVLSAAMFRPDVKTRSLLCLIRACGHIFREGLRFFLVIAGDGKERARLEEAAAGHLPGRVRFVGKVQRHEMHRFYSAGDLFAFPGIGESLGMVYLEAQSCGLPVVAFDTGGIREVVQNGQTGILVSPFTDEAFGRAVRLLLDSADQRRSMGRAAADHVRRHHERNENYRLMDRMIRNMEGKTQ